MDVSCSEIHSSYHWQKNCEQIGVLLEPAPSLPSLLSLCCNHCANDSLQEAHTRLAAHPDTLSHSYTRAHTPSQKPREEIKCVHKQFAIGYRSWITSCLFISSHGGLHSCRFGACADLHALHHCGCATLYSAARLFANVQRGFDMNLIGLKPLLFRLWVRISI